ncbi:DUF1232 domain-containing protein [Streptomyces sp. NPDC088725]|uniref:DUF1232 domain-containing protein n=1 Tax=Streptomyces sp. NPDC088725 TaxID=3365873 RepID=UPI003816CDF7
MSTELQLLIAAGVLLALITLAGAVVLAVRLVRARRRLRAAGVPAGNRWMFWAAMIYLVLPTDLLPDPIYLDDIGFLLVALRSLHTAEGKLPYAAQLARRRPGRGAKPVEHLTHK